MAGHRQSGWGSIVPAIIWPIIVVIALTPLLFGLAPRLCRLFALPPVQLGQLSVAFVGLLIEVFPAFRLVELLVALRSLFPLLLPLIARIGCSRDCERYEGRSEERRVGKESVSTGRYRGSPYN